MCIFVAQNHQHVSLTHDGQQNADINFQITTAHIQRVAPAKAITEGARGLAPKCSDVGQACFLVIYYWAGLGPGVWVCCYSHALLRDIH